MVYVQPPRLGLPLCAFTDSCHPCNLVLLLALTSLVQLMIPIPQYPIYSALCPLLGGSIIPYYLDEETGWSVNV